MTYFGQRGLLGTHLDHEKVKLLHDRYIRHWALEVLSARKSDLLIKSTSNQYFLGNKQQQQQQVIRRNKLSAKYTCGKCS